MTSTFNPLRPSKTAEARQRSAEIYTIVNRLGQPPTKGELEIIQQHIDNGADLDVHYNNGNQETVLEIALTREYTEAALLLVKNGADLSTRCVQNITPFIWAAMKGNAQVLQAMIDSGRAPPPDRDAYDSLGEGKTALIVAAQGNHAACAVMLIRYGADMNLKNNVGKSALDYAAEKGNEGTVRAMIEATNAQMAESLSRGAKNGVKPMRPLALKGRGGP